MLCHYVFSILDDHQVWDFELAILDAWGLKHFTQVRTPRVRALSSPDSSSLFSQLCVSGLDVWGLRVWY